MDINRKRKLKRIAKRSASIRRSTLRKKQNIKIKRIDSGVLRAQFTIQRFHHASMKELACRLQRQRGFFIDGFYKEALKEYFSIHFDVPKRMIKRERLRVQLIMDEETIGFLDDAAKLAYKQERPTSAVIEEAVMLYLQKPEHYLGKSFDEQNPQQYETI